MKNIADIRQEYTKSGLRESELPCDPLSLFSRWLQEAIDANVEEPTAIIVGTVSPEGRPSTRTVLLKGLHDGKFIFYTNYESRKGRQLAQNPYISLSFVWHELERQVHIEGTAAKVSPEESDTRFRQRSCPMAGKRSGTARQLGRICRHSYPNGVLARTPQPVTRSLPVYPKDGWKMGNQSTFSLISLIFLANSN